MLTFLFNKYPKKFIYNEKKLKTVAPKPKKVSPDVLF